MPECVDCFSVIAVIYDFLNEPSNGIHRAGAIAVGALSGYIIGIRSGFIRRLLYTSVGGLGIASVCYPKEASQYSQQAIAEAKTYATIVYNFAYGGMFTNRYFSLNQFESSILVSIAVKPGDEPKPIPIPSSLSDFYGTVANLFSTEKKK